MPQLTKKDYRFQYNQFTMWGHVANMLDENDPLREKAMERYGYEAFVNNNAEDSGVFTGTSDIYDEKGKLHKNVPNSKIMEGGTVGRLWEQCLLDTTDPGYIKYQQDGLKLAADIREKYKGKPDCEMLFAFLDIIETNKTSVMGENHGYENTPQCMVIANSRKMMDVIYDTPGGPKDAKTCREVAKEFALDKLYSAFNDVAKLGVEHANAWADGTPDPEKLRQIKARSDEAVNRFENAVIEFRDKHNADLKKPEKERRLYDLTKKENIDSQEMIGKGGRAIDTKQPLMRREYELKYENEILAAELMKARRETGFDKNKSGTRKDKNLRKLTNSLINDLTRHRNPAIQDDTPLSNEERAKRMQKLGEVALKLPGHPLADRIIEIMSRDLLKSNAEVISSAAPEQLKENKVPEVKNVDIGTISTGPKNDDNIIRNENIIIENNDNIIRNDNDINIESDSSKQNQINEINEPKKEENIINQNDDNIIRNESIIIENNDNIIRNDNNSIQNEEKIIIEPDNSKQNQINEINEPKKEENIINQNDDNIIRNENIIIENNDNIIRNDNDINIEPDNGKQNQINEINEPKKEEKSKAEQVKEVNIDAISEKLQRKAQKERDDDNIINPTKGSQLNRINEMDEPKQAVQRRPKQRTLVINEETTKYLQAMHEYASAARGILHDSPQYLAFHKALVDTEMMAKDIYAHRRQLASDKIAGNNAMKAYAAQVKHLKECAKAYEDYKLSDHTEDPKAHPEMKKLNSDDRRKLEIVRNIMDPRNVHLGPVQSVKKSSKENIL